MKLMIHAALFGLLVGTNIGHAQDQGRLDDRCDPYSPKFSTKSKNVAKCLNQKRDYLAVLNQRVNLLSDELLNSQARLFSIRNSLQTAEVPSKELQAALKEIEVLEAQANSLGDQMLMAQIELESLEQKIKTQKISNVDLKKERDAAMEKLRKIQAQYEVVKAGIARASKIRVEKALEQ